VYYAHGSIPAPDPDHSRFWAFIDFFLPDTAEDRALIAALVCAPLWFKPGIDRPAWIIDARDAQGCGKTTLAELVADLYGNPPISTSKQELSMKMDVLVKRCVSQNGRKARIMLVDNVTGDFNSPELADLITRKDITGIAPYGRGEEVRPNNLIYIITSNSASVYHDIADRSFYIHLRKPDTAQRDRAKWKESVQAYIIKHRLEIISDIIDMIANHEPFDILPQTRFAPFEQAIMQPCCETPEMYESVCRILKEAKEDSNIEQDQARLLSEMINFQIAAATGDGTPRPVFIKTDLLNSWGRKAIQDSYEYKPKPIQLIRNLSKTGFLPEVDKNVKRWPISSGQNRSSGVAWNFTNSTEIAVVLGWDGDRRITQEMF